MIAADIQLDATDVFPSSDPEFVLRKIGSAIRVLANKGNWDPGLGYMTVAVPASGDIFLPADVETPLRVNVNNRPAQFQDQYFEFDVNRPGDTGAQLGWTFAQQLPTPLQVVLATPTRLKVSNLTAAVRVTGIDDDTGERVESVTLQTVYDGCPTFREVIAVSKDVGAPNTYVDVLTEEVQGSISANGTVARYHWRDKAPSFRLIRLDGADARPSSIRLLYRRRTYEISTWQDYIPLGSKEAVVFMLRALRAFEAGQMDAGEALQAKALEFLGDDQTAREAAGKAAAAEGQKTSLANFNARFAGVVVAGELYDDAAQIFGPLGRERLLDRISQAAEELSRKASWDSTVGFADVDVTPSTDSSGSILAIPSWMDGVLAVQVEGRPTYPRSRWIDFHINGPWLDGQMPMDAFDYLDDSPLQTALPTGGAKLVFVRENSGDSALTVTVEGKSTSGRQVSESYPLLSDPATIPGGHPETVFKEIWRISKPQTAGYVRAHVRGTSPVIGAQLSEARPTEREFLFRRVRVYGGATRVTIAYRKKTARLANLDDVIPLRSRGALVEMMRSQAWGDPTREGYDPEKSDYHEAKAVRLLAEEQKARKPAQFVMIQVLDPLLETFHTTN